MYTYAGDKDDAGNMLVKMGGFFFLVIITRDNSCTTIS